MKVTLLILALTATVALAAVPTKLNVPAVKFEQFKQKFNKVYSSVEEEAKRLAIFAANLEIAAEYQAADSALIKAKRDAKANGAFFVEGEPKVALLIRIRG